MGAKNGARPEREMAHLSLCGKTASDEARRAVCVLLPRSTRWKTVGLQEQAEPEEEELKNAWGADWNRGLRDRSDRGTGARKRCLTSGISGERSESAACRG